MTASADTHTASTTSTGRFARRGFPRRRDCRQRVDAISVATLLTLKVPVARTLTLAPLGECSEPDLNGAAWLLRERDPAASSLLCTLAHCMRARGACCARELPHCTLAAALLAHDALAQPNSGYGDW